MTVSFAFSECVSVWHLHHDKNLQRVLSGISDAGMQLNHKCVFSVPELAFLGHKISANSISPMENKIMAMYYIGMIP